MKKEDSSLSPSSSSSSSLSSSSSSTLTMLARTGGGSRRHPLPPSDSQDLEDDLTLTEGAPPEEESLPRSPSSGRSDRQMVRMAACDLETLDDTPQPGGVPAVEQRPSCGSSCCRRSRREVQEAGRWRAVESPQHPTNYKRETLPRFTFSVPTQGHPAPVHSQGHPAPIHNLGHPAPLHTQRHPASLHNHRHPAPVYTPSECHTTSQCYTPKDCHTPTGCLTPKGYQSPKGCQSPKECRTPKGCQSPIRCQSPINYQGSKDFRDPEEWQDSKGCRGIQYDVAPYDPHPRAFVDESQREKQELLTPHHALTRRSSYGSSLQLPPWDPRYSTAPAGLPLSSVAGATMGGSVGNLLVLMETHLALQNIANNNNLQLNNNNNNNSSNRYPFGPRRCEVHNRDFLSPGDPLWCDNLSLPHAARLTRSHTSLLTPPSPPHMTLSRSSRSQGDLFSLTCPPPIPAKRKWTTITGLAAIGGSQPRLVQTTSVLTWLWFQGLSLSSSVCTRLHSMNYVCVGAPLLSF
nr:uncharacterized protein LOC128699060 [Cherax quadricarinatus]